MNTLDTLRHAFAITEGEVEMQTGPRYSTCEQQAEMARLLILRDHAIDAITGALDMYGGRRALREIREALDEMFAAEERNSQAETAP